MDYKTQYQMYLSQASAALEDACAKFLPEESEVCRAARYSLLGGGKRIRAVLVLSVCDMLGGDPQTARAFSAAVEMLHCYSLIHDDLPCMDNDDLRRGRPSCHKAFGEATAMLAGDVLLTEAFEAIANAIAAGILTTIEIDTVAAVPGRTTGEMPDDPYAQFEEIKDEPDDVCDCSKLYRVQIGAFRNRENAERLLKSALAVGFPAFIIYEDGYYKVQVGAYRILLNAIKMEQRLRRFRYSTYIVYS